MELWNGTRCECEPPFVGADCKQQLQEATFGHANESSRVEFHLEDAAATAIEMRTAIAVRVRTNKPTGVLFRLVSSGELDDDATSTFLGGELHDGRVEIVARLGGRRVERIRGLRRVDDNAAHTLALRRDGNSLELLVDGERDAAQTLERPFAHPLLVDRLLLGSVGGGDGSVGGGGANNQSDAAAAADFFKGTLHDFRVNRQSVDLATKE